jgi:WD40 repeat protein
MPIKGQSHTGQIVALTTPGRREGDTIYSTGFDDCVREINTLDASFTFVLVPPNSDVPSFAAMLTAFMINSRQAVSVKSQPRGIAVATPGVVFTALSDSIVIHENGSPKSAFPTTKFSPTSIAATSNGMVIVGGDVSSVLCTSIYPLTITCLCQDNKTHLFKYEGGTLKEDGILEGNKGAVTAVAISPDASKLVSGDVRMRL